MLATYQANLVNGKIEWIDQPPKMQKPVKIAVTLLPDTDTDIAKHSNQRRQPPAELKGLGKETGNIIDVPEMTAEWENDDFDYS